jgi:Trypsin-co-occurring domain 1
MEGWRAVAELVKYAVGGAGSVVIEVDQAPAESGRRPVARFDGIADFGQRIDDNLEKIKAAARTALARLGDGLDVDEIVLRFGVKMTGEAGAVIARTAVEGTFEVELTWRPGHRDGAGRGPES